MYYASILHPEAIVSIPFVDGICRPVFLGIDGRQYVFDDDGEASYGVWVQIDEPQMVARDIFSIKS